MSKSTRVSLLFTAGQKYTWVGLAKGPSLPGEAHQDSNPLPSNSQPDAQTTWPLRPLNQFPFWLTILRKSQLFVILQPKKLLFVSQIQHKMMTINILNL